MPKIGIPINMVDCNLYHDLLETNLCIVKNAGTDNEYLEFTVLDIKKSTLAQNADTVLVHKDQTQLYDFLDK